MRLTERLLAEWLHINYQEAADIVGWRPQESTMTSFEELPDANKKTMLFLASRLVDLLKDQD